MNSVDSLIEEHKTIACQEVHIRYFSFVFNQVIIQVFINYMRNSLFVCWLVVYLRVFWKTEP